MTTSTIRHPPRETDAFMNTPRTLLVVFILSVVTIGLAVLLRAGTIAEVASNLWQHVGVAALSVGGSLASGAGNHLSDVDFRVAVVPDQLAF